MLGLAHPLLIWPLDEAKVKDIDIKWIQGRQEEEAEEILRGGGKMLQKEEKHREKVQERSSCFMLSKESAKDLQKWFERKVLKDSIWSKVFSLNLV